MEDAFKVNDVFNINGNIFIDCTKITLERAYELYDEYKLCTLMKILNDEGEIDFYEEDCDEESSKVSM